MSDETEVFATDVGARAEGAVKFVYTNHRGETATRRVVPGKWRFGASEFHPEPQLLLEGYCLDRRADRTFAASGIADAEAEDDAVTFRSEVDAVLRQLDELASLWGAESVFRHCRDRLRTALKIGREE